MKKLLILGAGAGGTMIATKMRKLLSEREWQITLIDRDPVHHYQPGWLLVPFGVDTPQGCVRPKKDFISRGVNFVIDTINSLDPIARKVECKNSTHTYDWIIIATGARMLLPLARESLLMKCPAFWMTGAAKSTISTPMTVQKPFTAR